MELRNKAGEILDYALHGKEFLEKTKKLVILCHGLADNKDGPVLMALADELAAQSLSSLRFSFAGNGESEGKFEEATYHKEVDDLQAVIDYFKKEQGIDQFCLVGHSMAGGVIRVVAAQEPTIKALVALAGVAKAESFKDKFPDYVKVIEEEGVAYLMQEEKGERFPMTRKYLESAENINIMASAPKITCPVLCVLGSEDMVSRRKHEQEWLDALPERAQSWLVILPGLDHLFNRHKDEASAKRGKDYVVSVVLPWIIEYFA